MEQGVQAGTDVCANTKGTAGLGLLQVRKAVVAKGANEQHSDVEEMEEMHHPRVKNISIPRRGP